MTSPDRREDRRSLRPGDRPASDRVDAVVEEALELELESGPPGETLEEARRHILVRLAIVVGGTLVTVLGLALLALPGPGLLVVALGLGLLATEVPFAARLLERVRKRLPADADGKLPRSMIVTMVLTCVVATGASIWWSFFRS